MSVIYFAENDSSREFASLQPDYYMKSGYLLILIFAAAAYLGLMRLDNTVFWDDEAETGIVAKNFLKFGRLTGWDGRNLLAYNNGGILDENFRSRNPPLGYLTAAASFRLFGVSTWAGRFPFLLAGLACIFLLAWLLRQDFGRDSPIWVYGTAALAFSVVFLLNIRQCRYYSLAMLFSLLAFLFYRRCLATGRLIYFILLAAAAVLLFYSNFLLCAAFLSALLLAGLIFHNGEMLKQRLKFAAAGILLAAATIPYGLYFRIWQRPDISSTEAWYVRKLILLWWNFRELNLPGIVPWTIAAGLVCFVIYYRKKEKNISLILEWAVLTAAYVVFLALLSPQPTEKAKIADSRYLTLIIPFSAGLAGMLIWFIHRKTKLGAVATFSLIVLTNLASVEPNGWEFRWILPAYINEIHRDYPTAYGEVVRFLEKNAGQDDKVFACPEYASYPLMFYLGRQVKMCCLLDSQTTLPMTKVKGLGSPLLLEENFPDWIVFLGLLSKSEGVLEYFSRLHIQGAEQVQFYYYMVETLDVYDTDTSRPELPWHRFGPVTSFDRQSRAVYILKKGG